MKVLLLALGFFSYALFADHTSTSNFGYPGYSGSCGASGRPGYDGQNLSITATGASANYDLSGTSGENGYEGRNGSSATNCYQPPNTHYNLYGASGGSGGSGGDGGRGGNSGDLTVYYNELQSLRSVYIRAIPGRGGYGAYGSRGGYGCRCSVRQWNITENNVTNTYYCYDGNDGMNGRYGDNGTMGRYGSVTLIGQTTPLLPTQPTITIPMQNMLSGPFQLSNNEWETKSGTSSLFAPGSQLNDTYKFFKRRVEKNYVMKWQADRPLTDFTDKPMTLTLEGQEVRVTVPSDVWQLGHEEAEQANNLKTYVFDGAVYRQEALNLAITKVQGGGSNLTLNVEDRAKISDKVKTEFRLTYRTKAAIFYYERYSGSVPSSLVTQNGNNFEIAVGKLPISSKWLSSGNMARIQVDIYRTYGSHRDVRSLVVDYTIH